MAADAVHSKTWTSHRVCVEPWTAIGQTFGSASFVIALTSADSYALSSSCAKVAYEELAFAQTLRQLVPPRTQSVTYHPDAVTTHNLILSVGSKLILPFR